MNDRVISLRRSLVPHVENIVWLGVVGSTHAMARRLITEMEDEHRELGPTVIIADHQDEGQGRGDRRWRQAEHGMYLNWLRSGIDQRKIALLPILAAAAARRALAEVGVANTRIKWPNDILVDGQKLAGLLVFARHGEINWVTVGLGVNLGSAPVFADRVAGQATAVADHAAGEEFDLWRREIAGEFVSLLIRSIADPDTHLDDWRSHLIQQPGDTINVRLASGDLVSGTIKEITPDGFLNIRETGGERIITGGDIVES